MVQAAVTDHEVLVAGGGPTGLMLAGELALAAVDVAVIERRRTQEVEGSRALGLLSRTIEVLDQRGIADRFLDAGFVVPSHGYGGIRFDIADLPTRHPYVLALPQSRFEPILAEWVTSLGVPILRDHEIEGFEQDPDGVTLRVSGSPGLRAAYLVGCDGGRSLVRKAAGIGFTGLDASTSWMIAEATMDGEPELGFRHDELGTHALARPADDGPVRVLLTEREVSHSGPPDLDDLRAALVTVYGSDFGLRSASWVSRFTDATRQAEEYRRGRVLVAGDAAHVHPPQGGQGMQTGIQDAVNLGWKLARVLRGVCPDSLLDSYHDERHPVGARVLRSTMAQVTLSRPDERHRALRDTVTEMLAMDEPRRRVGAMLTALDVHYDLGDAHPVVGRRMPDLDLQTAEGATRVFDQLHEARPLLLDLRAVTADDGTDRRADEPNRPTDDPVGLTPGHGVRVVRAGCAPAWDLPVLGTVTAPPAVLVRPDGHVAWAGRLTDPGLPAAMQAWCGSPS